MSLSLDLRADLRFSADVPGFGRVRLDLAYRGHKVAIEYDGDEHHGEERDVKADEARREALRRAGWHVIVVRNEDFQPDALDRWLGGLRRVLTDRGPTRPRLYARAERTHDRR